MNSEEHDRSVPEHRVEAILTTLGPADFERIDPPAQVWNGIAAELAPAPSPIVDVRTAQTGASEQARRRWFPSTAVLAVAAAAVIVAGLVGVQSVRNADTAEELASAQLSDEGLPVATTATANAKYICDGDTCSVELDLSALPEAQDGELELWVINADVTDMHSLGVVDASGTFALPAGVSWDSFPIVDISVEPFDDDPTHSGQSVLRGTLQPSDT